MRKHTGGGDNGEFGVAQRISLPGVKYPRNLFRFADERNQRL